MKVLVIGGGGREHALCWKLKQSPLVSELFCSPGNAGIAGIAQCLEGDPVEVAQRVNAEFVVVGPEVPLADGVVDRLQEVGIRAFGPSKRAAQLEASKSFCKEILQKYQIPTARAAWFEEAEAARKYLEAQDEGPIVLKADGLAAGKGVIVATNRREALEAVDGLFAMQTGQPRLLIEECMTGEEVSLIALSDGESIVPLVPAQDHKRIGEGDTGLNTGGMGCYSPVPAFTTELQERAIETILKPTLAALKAEGIVYRGALYAGLMLTEEGPKVLEYNCRFGDPETQVILPRLQSDLMPLLLACAEPLEGSNESTLPLDELPCEWSDEAAVCVVMSAGGYPANDYRKGDPISGLDKAAAAGATVFHAGTALKDGEILTSGGRVLGVTALGKDFLEARENCYRGVEPIAFDGAYFRRDIGWRCL